MSDGTKKPSLARNAISAVGLVIAAISLANIIFLVVADATGVHNPYVGILAYAVVPAFLVAGLALFALGMLLERRRRRRIAPDHIAEYPSIDLNSPHTRRVFVISTIGIFV